MATMSSYLDATRLASLATDPDYGPYTGHQMDPRHEPDDTLDEMIAQIDEAERCLKMARDALSVHVSERSVLCARSLMIEARGWLQEGAK